MLLKDIDEENHELFDICAAVKDLIINKRFSECDETIKKAIGKFPHAPHLHNLMGILLEKKGDHSLAMKHFRAAWALDPTYMPARYNMEQYGEFFNDIHNDAYFEEDCYISKDMTE